MLIEQFPMLLNCETKTFKKLNTIKVEIIQISGQHSLVLLINTTSLAHSCAWNMPYLSFQLHMKGECVLSLCVLMCVRHSVCYERKGVSLFIKTIRFCMAKKKQKKTQHTPNESLHQHEQKNLCFKTSFSPYSCPLQCYFCSF